MNKFWFFVLLIFVATVTNAQENASFKKYRLSLLASPHISWFKSDYKKVENDGLLPGIKFGVNFDYFFDENYSFSTSLLINNVKAKLAYSDPNVPFDIDNQTVYFNDTSVFNPVSVTYKLRYIEIPFSLKLLTNPIGYTRIYGIFGLVPQFNFNAYGSANQKSIEDANFSNEVNFFNFAYQIGGGIEYQFGNNMKLNCGLVFNNGFIDITTNNKNGRASDKTILNSMNLQVGIIF